MGILLDGFGEALRLLAAFDPELVAVVLLTLKVSAASTLVSSVVGIAGGAALALTDFPGRRVVVSLVNTGMGLPPVVAGLFVTVLLWRSGPLASLGLLYTPSAMVVAQVLIATPLVMGISVAALQQLPDKLRYQVLALGATRRQLVWTLVREARLPLLGAVMAGFGGVISEVGASMMVGGNIRGQTRVLTTATVMETGKGNLEVAIGLGIILLALSFALNAVLTHVQQGRRPR